MKRPSTVYVPSLKKNGTVLKRHDNGDLELRVGTLTLRCKESDVQPARVLKKDPYPYKISPKHHPALKPVTDKRKLRKIDLHGLRVEEALVVLEKRINDAIIADLDRLEVVHGIGMGKLLAAVHEHLAKMASSGIRFRLDDVNTGTTWVYFE